MKKFFPVLLVVLFMSSISNGQPWKENRKQISIGLGVSNFLGDLGGANGTGSNGIKDFNLQSILPTISVGFGYQIIKRIGIKTNFVYGWLAGDDKYTENAFRKNRNQSFRSTILELSLQAEFYVTKPDPKREYSNLLKTGSFLEALRSVQISSYVFIGIGGIYFNPKAQYIDGDWYSLRDLHTAGQGLPSGPKQYSKIALAIPIGFGFKVPINKKFSIGIEYGIRLTNTDYIDDCSGTYYDSKAIGAAYGPVAEYFSNPALSKNDTYISYTLPGEVRGDKSDNDSYMFGFIHLYYNLGKKQARYFIF